MKCYKCESTVGFWAPAGSNDWACLACGVVEYNVAKRDRE